MGSAIEPTFDEESGLLTFPNVKGVTYFLNGEEVKTQFVSVDGNADVEAKVKPPARFRDGTVTSWGYAYTSDNTGSKEELAPQDIPEGLSN